MEEEIIVVIKPRMVKVTNGKRVFKVESEVEMSAEMAQSYVAAGLSVVTAA